jgi:hypothetical protein
MIQFRTARCGRLKLVLKKSHYYVEVRLSRFFLLPPFLHRPPSHQSVHQDTLDAILENETVSGARIDNRANYKFDADHYMHKRKETGPRITNVSGTAAPVEEKKEEEEAREAASSSSESSNVLKLKLINGVISSEGVKVCATTTHPTHTLL